MRRSNGSFGMVLLVVVMAVVLMLVARAWQKLAQPSLDLAPSAIAISAPAGPAAPATGSPDPDLDRTRAATDAHASAVGEALESID